MARSRAPSSAWRCGRATRGSTRASGRAASTTDLGARPSALVLQHGPLGPPGILAAWLRERGVDHVVHHVSPDAALPDPGRFAFVASLGSARSPRERQDPAVARELELLATCVEREIPVLGLCYGGQALAAVLGGRVDVIPEPELGWQRVETAAPELVSRGPWLQWHYDAFTPPPGAEELAWSASCSQAFRMGPHLGVQFHPESTAETVASWARHDHARLPGALEDHLDRLEAGDRRHGQRAASAAMRLFDGFWAGRAARATLRRSGATRR